MNRRIRNEINKHQTILTTKYISNIENIYNTIQNELCFNVYIYSLNKSFKVYMKYPQEYPFCPPDIFINKYKYRSLIKSNKFNKNIINNIYGKNFCVCCHSITCRDNWGPTLNSKNVLNEIVDNILIKIYCVDIFHAKKIFKKYNVIDDLSQEIIKYL